MLPLPRTGPSSRWRLQFTTKIKLSSFSREASVSAPSDSGSSHSPSPKNPHTSRLVDCRDGAEPHGYRRKLPEIRHQPGIRIRRETRMIAQLMPEILQML